MAEEKKEPVDIEQDAEVGKETETARDDAPEVTKDANEETSGQPQQAQESSDAEDSPKEAQEADSEPAKEEKKTEKTSRFFGKNKKEDKKDQQIAELTDRVKRQMAEFENFRKRTEKEKSAMFEIGAKSVLEKILPIVDNFERGLAAIPEEEKESSTAVGMDKIYKQLVKVLDELDVKPIEAVGKEFSPDFHNAVMQAEEEGVGENIIVQEFQKGYLYRGSVLRHSMVKVNK